MAWGQGAKVPADNRPLTEGERDHPQERAKWFLRGRTVNGRPAAAERDRAYKQKLNNRKLHAAQAAAARSLGTQSTQSSESAVPGASAPAPSYSPQAAGLPGWTPLGPAPTATAAYNDPQQDYGPAVGRVTAVVVDQADANGNTVFVGGASGGLWRTANAMDTATRACNSSGVCTASPIWTPLIDNQATLTVGSIALQPHNSNLVLVGTGEANNSADSYYGLGILRSTDAGNTWSLISKTADGVYDFHGLGFTHIAFSTATPDVVVATAAAASGGIYVGAETGGSGIRGIYYSIDAGQTWARASVSDGSVTPDAGSTNAVVYNSARQKFYANIRYHGFYSSSDGQTWTRLSCQPGDTVSSGFCTTNSGMLKLSSCPSSPYSSSCPLYRAEMAVVPGRDEMYVWIVDNNDTDRGIYQTLDGGQTWTRISTTGIDSCGDTQGGCGTGNTSQASYNITLAAIPNGTAGPGGFATDLYAGGVNQYKCALNSVSNPTCATNPFLNLTHVYGCNPTANIAHVHPDEHGIDFLGNDGTGAIFNGNPSLDPPVFFGNDGGIYRVGHSSNLTSGTCPSSGTTPASPFDNLSASMGSMIQFVWFSQHPSDPTTLFGGTQDNGSPGVSSASPSSGNWLSINNGDGGYNDINPLNPNEWFTSNPDMSLGSGIQRCTNGISCTWDPTAGGFSTVVYRTTIGGDSSPFYTNFMLDPQASTRMMVGSCRVWRGSSGGSGFNALSYNFDTLDATTCASTAQNMAIALAAGGPCKGTFCDSGPTPGATTGGGSQVIWAGTDGDNSSGVGGEVWVTLNAYDGGPAAWTRVDGAGNPVCSATYTACNINPLHYPISAIAVDPHDSSGNTAYVTVMGFGAGHVFKTSNAGATWAKLDGVAGGTGLPDNPADSVVADPTTANLLYVGTDVGVFQSMGDGNWTEVGPGSGTGALPNVVTTALKMYNGGGQVKLRVSTYGRGIWEYPLTPGYNMSVSNPVVNVYPNQVGTFTGMLSTYYGYSNPVTITCGTGKPAVCNGMTVSTPAINGSFTVTASNPAVSDFSFNLVGTGSDDLQQQVPVTLQVADFSLTAPPDATVGRSNSASVQFNVAAEGSFTGDVALACSGIPAGTSCSFSPSVSLIPGGTTKVTLNIPTYSTTALGTYTVTITGTGPGSRTHTQTMTLTVVSSYFSLAQAAALAPSPAKPGQQLSGQVNFSSVANYAGTLDLSCDPAPACALNPNRVTLAAGATLPSALTLNTTGMSAGNWQANVTALDNVNHASKSLGLPYLIIDYSFTASAPGPLVPDSSVNISLSLIGLNGYSSTVAVQCTPQTPLTCTLSPPQGSGLPLGQYLVTSAALPITATVVAPANTPGASYDIAFHTWDTAYTTLTHDQTVSVGVQDFSMSATPASNTVAAGASSTHTITITGAGGFSDSVALSCSGLPAKAACTFLQNPISAGGSTTLTITTTAPTVSQMRPPAGRRGKPLYALWLALPGIIGVIGMAAAPRRKRSKWLALLGLALIACALLALPSCGGGGGSSTTSPPIPTPGTPAGTNTIVVTGASGSLSRSTSITLTVQ